MKQKEREKAPVQQSQTEGVKAPTSVYDDSTFDAFDRGHSRGPIPLQNAAEPTVEVKPELVKDIRDEMKLPDKQFRRNITLSEEQFRKLELIMMNFPLCHLMIQFQMLSYINWLCHIPIYHLYLNLI